MVAKSDLRARGNVGSNWSGKWTSEEYIPRKPLVKPRTVLFLRLPKKGRGFPAGRLVRGGRKREAALGQQLPATIHRSPVLHRRISTLPELHNRADPRALRTPGAA